MFNHSVFPQKSIFLLLTCEKTTAPLSAAHHFSVSDGRGQVPVLSLSRPKNKNTVGAKHQSANCIILSLSPFLFVSRSRIPMLIVFKIHSQGCMPVTSQTFEQRHILLYDPLQRRPLREAQTQTLSRTSTEHYCGLLTFSDTMSCKPSPCTLTNAVPFSRALTTVYW